jgi:hypothetical protein
MSDHGPYSDLGGDTGFSQLSGRYFNLLYVPFYNKMIPCVK